MRSHGDRARHGYPDPDRCQELPPWPSDVCVGNPNITPAWKFLTLSPSVSEDPHSINTSSDIRIPIRDRFGTTDPVSVAR